MKNIFQVLLVFTIFSIVACQPKNKKINIKAYYFPLEKLKEARVYEYHSVNKDSTEIEYWIYQTYKNDTASFLTGKFYDDRFYLLQSFTEEIVGNGSLMHNYFLYAFDSIGNPIQVPTEILVPNVFPFEVQDDGGIFLFKLKWNSGGTQNASTTLIRNRRYIGKTNYPYKGKLLDCVAFELREIIDLHIEGDGHSEPELAGKELYAKGIGLIYYKKQISETQILEYELADIYTLEKFEAKLNEH